MNLIGFMTLSFKSFKVSIFRINIEVLSVVAQQILSILSALASNAPPKFMFQGRMIDLVPSVGIFITMNPGYAGRTELPDNLKSMFRPIAMVTPDSAMIAEITLFAEGFSGCKVIIFIISLSINTKGLLLIYEGCSKSNLPN